MNVRRGLMSSCHETWRGVAARLSYLGYPKMRRCRSWLDCTPYYVDVRPRISNVTDSNFDHIFVLISVWHCVWNMFLSRHQSPIKTKQPVNSTWTLLLPEILTFTARLRTIQPHQRSNQKWFESWGEELKQSLDRESEENSINKQSGEWWEQ